MTDDGVTQSAVLLLSLGEEQAAAILSALDPGELQLLGEREVRYLTRGTDQDCARRINRIVTLEPPVLVLADGQQAPQALLDLCPRRDP